MWNVLLTGMDVGVLFHVGLLMKAFTTILTRVWSGVWVNEKMCGQCTRSLEWFSALFALKEKDQKGSCINIWVLLFLDFWKNFLMINFILDFLVHFNLNDKKRSISVRLSKAEATSYPERFFQSIYGILQSFRFSKKAFVWNF